MKRCTETDSAIMRCPDYPWKCEMCGAYKEPTNADHIRSMTDEELAETIVREFCAVSNNTVEFIVAKTRFRLWLKQPYKEDT